GAGQGGKRKASAEADASGLPLKRSHVESQGRSTECGTAPKRAVASSSDVPEDITDIQGLLSWINDVARAVEVPHENPSSRAPGCFIAELPDNPRDNRELSTQAASGTPTDPFWGLPPSPGFLPELQRGLSQLHPVVPPATARLSPRPTTLAVSTPPSAQSAEEGQQREPQEVQAEKKNRGSTKRAKRPAPAGTPPKGESSQQEQPTNSAPAKKRKLPPRRERTERKGRKHPCQGKLPGASAGASGSGQAGTASELHLHLRESIQAVHPLGQRVTVVGPVRRPPSVQPQPSPSAGPAALRPQDGGADKAAPAPPGGTVREEGAAKKTAPSCPRPSPQRSSSLRRDPPSPSPPSPPVPHQQQPRPRRPVDFVPCVGPRAGGGAAPIVMEESLPITAEQRPERERMKKLAQEERQRAARQMKIGPVQFLVQRETDMAIADQYGYP
ncbi:nascent polypeptide-associated complex subunit alpha, muscle-specific form-like, partial [Meleagris gallopavo]|uniref:nascent polypeptide-associated complex subunit alpha, muscle-specific form-like n=1 Tax=Meleagris gallopavo TaxID=9103 RepID=UPI0012AC192E